MALIVLNKDVFFESSEFTSCQYEEIDNDPSISGSMSYMNFSGSVITLKNGRKIFTRMSPEDVLAKLTTAKEQKGE